jgi:hypothetical protein
VDNQKIIDEVMGGGLRVLPPSGLPPNALAIAHEAR